MQRTSISFAAAAMLAALFPSVSHAQDAKAGAQIAAQGGSHGAAACAGCHGANGEGNAAAGFPRLAGLAPKYVEEQLDNFADNKRKNPVMAPIAKQLTATERREVAAYFGSLPAPAGVNPPDEAQLKTSDTGAWLATRGRWDDNLPACVQCHGPGGIGVGAAFPAIAGQSSAYIAAQLNAFKTGARPGGPMNLMAAVAKKMSDTDISAVADYFGGAHPAASQSESNQRKK